ncbi:organic hydroperoxide resistance protein [Streptomyces europaeiscabiei]|jgi:Ohr subfamily peroxiredoxin|uniref:Organic hydroperoxide resistance protein n=1 Tax=Streptomyces europaeiscabiei TaxID=146819 RepID=A0AAJ2UPV5_9ACTN|nr:MULTISPECIES: organic hydroperoxide resistance protein [Streptomyces]KFF96174.1 Ohr subfamily peroxiredoxin [Streptomyces scabiei]MDX2526552.1 organic hydroperoxide resistance protein [Streptomyces europaeiscabiei]MDX2763797.1 organic hydroperoxide resistance protein [Streptomyces europaeiscabiei]MDX2774910.1 organic hydroperoxide resistance protein [Streptomyces europaeiscabiei]MDX3134610.1 organic hydroperoxide resistance protein [Streptomyces europaeiscabiei]
MDALYTAVATATHGRDGRAVSNDGKLDLDLALPVELGGNGQGTNPEQLFAAGYSACFASALGLVGRAAKVDVSDAAVTAEVGIGKQGEGFALKVTLRVELPDTVDEATGRKLVEQAHQVCPYSNATRNNIPVELVVE